MNSITDEEPAPVKSVTQKLIDLNLNQKEFNKVKKIYPAKFTPYYVSLIKEKDDAIWKQCVPDIQELQDNINVEDPLYEEYHTKIPFLVHKYPDRVLLLASNRCAMYCRFCTRKRKVGMNEEIPLEKLFEAIEYIKNHKEVRDVLISGGDPLMRTDKELEQIISKIREISHVQMIRIGTRMPCVNPFRITKKLVNMLKKYHPLYINIHFNHPSEITPESSKACNMLVDAGIPLGSQTVLLKGVNDNVQTMIELMHKLLEIRVRPYYIYQCDEVKGVEHFKTPFETGINLIKNMQGFTSGLAIPTFIIDCEGGKIPISPQYVKNIDSDSIELVNYQNKEFKLVNHNK
jgi:lysine 2,3-aminomutase